MGTKGRTPSAECSGSFADMAGIFWENDSRIFSSLINDTYLFQAMILAGRICARYSRQAAITTSIGAIPRRAKV